MHEKYSKKIRKAIRQYEKKGYHCRKVIDNEITSCPPTLRPTLFGKPLTKRVYRHPLAPEENDFAERFK